MTAETPVAVPGYVVERELGRGGMGVVYLARDERLGRRVALKVVHKELDRDGIARLEREAVTLAGLNHPNIAMLYGVEDVGAGLCLVMEYVEGPTLQERLANGGLTVREALAIGAQVAWGVEAAHAAGVIHRDLKPANVKVMSGDRVKVLDFGLAKSAALGPLTGGDPASTPTARFDTTASGVILGTVGYMAPEQARGQPVDGRADIWAVGCILYECLTGRRAFIGGSGADTLAAILGLDPDWSALPEGVPGVCRALLRRSLVKDPARRLHHIADLRIELEDAATSSATGKKRAARADDPGTKPGSKIMRLGSGRVDRVRRAEVSAGEGQELVVGREPALAVSPDGKLVAFGAGDGKTHRLHVRAFDSFEAVELPGSEGGRAPFFSPDGQRVGFFADGELVMCPASGGTPIPLAHAPEGCWGSWGADGEILFVPGWASGLWRIHERGGGAEPIAAPDPREDEGSYLWPQMLPGGGSVLFTVLRERHKSMDDAVIVVQDLKTGTRRTLVQGGTHGRLLASGHLMYGRAGSLMVMPLDPVTLDPAGPATAAVSGVRIDPVSGAVHASASDDGTLAYVPASGALKNGGLCWVDRAGEAEAITKDGRRPSAFRLSPDGKRIAAALAVTNAKLWVLEIATGAWTPLTFGAGNDDAPVWYPDGTKVAFASDRAGGGGTAIYVASVERGREPELLVQSGRAVTPLCWTPDGEWLLYEQAGDAGGARADLWMVGRSGERKKALSGSVGFDRVAGSISPNGRWVAYESHESGKPAVCVAPLGEEAAPVIVSPDGGEAPQWSRGGRGLFYRAGAMMMMAPIEQREPAAGREVSELFDTRVVTGGDGRFDVARDGRFLMVRAGEPEAGAARVRVVFNWFGELAASPSSARLSRIGPAPRT